MPQTKTDLKSDPAKVQADIKRQLRYQARMSYKHGEISKRDMLEIIKANS